MKQKLNIRGEKWSKGEESGFKSKKINNTTLPKLFVIVVVVCLFFRRFSKVRTSLN